MRKLETTPIAVGCCGFAAAQSKYFKTFAVVEVQQTFYQPPRPETALRWREIAPSGFEFTLKAWQLVTHEASSPTYRRLKARLSGKDRSEAGAFRWSGVVRKAWDTTIRIAGVLEADKIVFQCPASFAPTQENMDRMRAFFGGIEREGITCLWEPRGAWKPELIEGLCRELDLVHCVDPFKDEAVTREMRYYRLHGVGGYRHAFTDGELRALSERCRAGAAHYVLFNNVDMFADAVRFKKLVG